MDVVSEERLTRRCRHRSQIRSRVNGYQLSVDRTSSHLCSPGSVAGLEPAGGSEEIEN
jgi:hypothetical protein